MCRPTDDFVVIVLSYLDMDHIVCSECKHASHDVLCSKYVSYHLDLDMKLSTIRKNTCYNATKITMSCDENRNIYVDGHGIAVRLLYSIHWNAINASDFNKILICNFFIDTADCADCECVGRFTDTYLGQIGFMCRKIY